MPLKLKECQGTRVVLIRHGLSTYNDLGLYQGCSDESLLTDAGRRAARQIGAYLKGLAFDEIYSSSLKRAHQTAREILGIMAPNTDPKTIVVTDLLRETDLPAWRGLRFQYVREKFATDYRTWKQRPHEFCMVTPQKCLYGKVEKVGRGESVNSNSPPPPNIPNQYFYPALDIYKRVEQFWQEVLPRHIGHTLLLISHGGTNRALINTAMGATPNRYHCIQQSNCGISVLCFPDGSLKSAQLEAVNLTSHIGKNLPQPPENNQGWRLLLVPSETTNLKQIQQLAQLLQEITIDFSLIENFNCSQATARQILQHHSATVQLMVLQDNFPEAWLQAIAKRSDIFASTAVDSNKSITGLVVARNNIIKSFIKLALGISSEQLWRLQLYPGTVSSLYYPDPHQFPILQAMNVSATEKDLIFQPMVTKTISPVKE
jgi:phosphoserine phosphatase